MKYIITESQNLQMKKVNFLKNYIQNLLSKYKWFKGDVKIDVTTWDASNNKIYPLYNIILNTGGRSYHAYDEGSDIENDINTMFGLLFPKDEDGDSSAVWDVLFV